MPSRNIRPEVEGLPKVLPPSGVAAAEAPPVDLNDLEGGGNPPPAAEPTGTLAPQDPMPGITDPLENPFADPVVTPAVAPAPPEPPPPPEPAAVAPPGEFEESVWLP